MPARSWFRGCGRALWIRRLFGQMPEPSTAARGVEQWIASLRATHALPSQSPDSARAWTILDICGPTSPASSEKPRRHLSSSKTSQTTFGWDSEKSVATYEEWATGLRQDCLLRLKRARRIFASDSSLWPTATLSGNTNTPEASEKSGTGLRTAAVLWPTVTQDSVTSRSARYRQGGTPLTLMASDLWPTPNPPNGGRAMKAEDVAERGATEKGKRQVDLGSAAKFWPTPKTPSGGAEARASISKRGAGGEDLEATTQMWQTPATDSFRCRGGDRKDEMGLDQQARLWATPSSLDWKGKCTTLIRPNGQHRLDQLDRQAEYFRLRPETSSTGSESLSATPPLPPLLNRHGNPAPRPMRRLNPLFVEWLMGVPRGWTSLERLATESYQLWRLTHSALLRSLLERLTDDRN